MTSCGDSQALDKLIGRAPGFEKVLRTLPGVAKSDATLLLLGETGTGKELAARAIHYLSPRAAYPFVAVNSGSLPDSLLEEELFGHERGAYTDAHKRRAGLVAQADKGTLFLDEIDALGSKGQVCLLRLLQEKTYRSIGSCVESKADVRIITATNAPLEELIERKCLRADLYYRICILRVVMPPLRERVQDILPLTEHFIRKHSPPERGFVAVSQDAGQKLCQYAWPGNIRELENATIRALCATESNVLRAEEFELAGDHVTTGAKPEQLPLSNFKQMKRQAVDAFERHYLERLMCDHVGNVSRAAKYAGKERRDLGKLLKKHGLDPRLFFEQRCSG